MDYLLVGSVALVVAGLTLFSGFGLGTLLLPAFAIFFPIQTAVAATAIVHLANNVFKIALIGCNTDRRVLLRFGLAAVLFAFLGAQTLRAVAAMPDIATYQFASRAFVITPTGLTIGALIIAFAILDLAPSKKKRLEFGAKSLALGGALSGFFGGLSGHQGALRSVFLIRAGLDRDAYIATAAAASLLVDITRLLVYGLAIVTLADTNARSATPLILTACACAFTGSFIGTRLVKKTTIKALRTAVGIALLLAGSAMATGLI